ncbi:hypothetical protein C8R44DRAFT_829090 [Mycena epipterygia]|nr:hypothetical protein C8R44DRAFT_829090 [Mycena epipterygia]
MAITLIVDDHDAEVQYHCPVTKETVEGSYYRNTWTSIDSLSCGQQSAWFSHTFNGTQTRIWASAAQANHNYSVRIDDGPLVVQSGDGYFESPVLEDGLHTITYAAGDMSLYPTLDYLTFTAGSSTQLLGRTVIVDDSEIPEYSGDWSLQSPTQLTLSRPESVYLNTTHWTSTVGDTFTLQFNGNSISVYGVVPNLNITAAAAGNSSAAYIVDGVSTVIPVPSESNQVHPMSQFFHADLEAGTHTLVFNVTEVAPSHVIGIDFVLYNSSDTTSGTSPVKAPVVAPSKKTSHTGVIVAATLGTLAALVLLALLLFLYRRRRSSKSKTSEWDVVTKANQ